MRVTDIPETRETIAVLVRRRRVLVRSSDDVSLRLNRDVFVHSECVVPGKVAHENVMPCRERT